MSIDQWTGFLLEREVTRYCCGGTHLLHSLALMMEAHARHPLLTLTTLEQLRSQCRDYSKMLEASQHADGAWQGDWIKDTQIEGQGNIEVHLTGHILEGQMYLPQDLRISPNCAGAALQYLARAYLTVDDRQVQAGFCPFSHAGRVLLFCATAAPPSPQRLVRKV